ncbi:hypothetical protein [Streptomyces rubellomurinus]|uniref:Uncharacterized protein n=1 Tax=Streptomyces rubellomurinus (strain ATCC 31215) TaxID=359131 RepID=A0A0F2TMD7_STRR3|nr:hypothetical protein [Streptomyces rubellomurinus]KJS63666.1 hypothetical protein VM95_02080 [Streptomyces rubellomurinus]
MEMRIGPVGVALRFAESVLLAPGQRRARRNAWAAVCENRRYAADRRHDAAATATTAGATTVRATTATAAGGRGAGRSGRR